MGLNGALQVGRSGLLASQAAVQTTGNNLANVATPGYHRRRVNLAAADGRRIGPNAYVGRGVRIESITRQIDEALDSRLRGAVADQSHSLTKENLLGQIQSLQNELSDHDLSTRLQTFFNRVSDLANKPQDESLRTLVIQGGQDLAGFVKQLHSDLTGLRKQVDKQAGEAAQNVNHLLDQVEQLNQRIALSSSGHGGANGSGAAGLKDQRDSVLADLSQYLDISTVTHDNGSTDVFVGSLPIVLDGKSRGVELKQTTADPQTTANQGPPQTPRTPRPPQLDLVIADDKSPLDVSSGRLGALVQFQQKDLPQTLNALDTFTHQLINQVNRVHSQGRGTTLPGSITGDAQVLDPAVALDGEDAGLDFAPTNGSFQVHVHNQQTGRQTTHTVHVDLDGIDPANDTSLNSLVAGLNGIGNVKASVTPAGKLKLATSSNDLGLSFSDDSSGTLAALGVNTFFTGSDGHDVAVNTVVANDPSRLAAAAGDATRPGDNQNALALAKLRDRSVGKLGGRSLADYWNGHVEDIAARTAQAKQQAQADTTVRDNLARQQQQVSGVNVDEETINLLQYQRAYQASARVISAVDELMKTLINLV